MPPKKAKDVDSEQFLLTFKTKSLREDFNRPAALFLKKNIENYIKDDEKADDALDKITKLLEHSRVSVSNKLHRLDCHRY